MEVNNEMLVYIILKIAFTFIILSIFEGFVLLLNLKFLFITFFTENYKSIQPIIPYLIPPYILMDCCALFQYSQWK